MAAMSKTLPHNAADTAHFRDKDKFRTFGRAKGKTLSPAQISLMDNAFPKYDISETIKSGKNPFADIEDEAWFEIGFGGAEHLIWQAKHNPQAHILGVEPFLNGIVKAVKGIEDNALKNVSLYRGDARDVIDLIPDNALDKVFVLFPDPWHKKRHHKRRLIQDDFVAQIHRILKPNGIFRFGSDIIHYVDWAITRIHRHGGFDWSAQQQSNWRTRPDDWPETRYLQKAIREGRSGHFFEFTRKDNTATK